MSAIIFDIETGPLDESIVLNMAVPFAEPVQPGEFDPAAVKVGNLKDQAKIDAKILEAKQRHESAVSDFELTRTNAYAAWKASAIGSAALHPATGMVVAIGYKKPGSCCMMDFGDEPELLNQWWRIFKAALASHTNLVGHNILDFDLPFLVRRSWILGIEVPKQVRDYRGYWNQLFVDTGKLWQCGTRGERFSLDFVDRAFGGTGKDVTGKNFHELLKNDAEAAKAYLSKDLDLTLSVAEKMGAA